MSKLIRKQSKKSEVITKEEYERMMQEEDLNLIEDSEDSDDLSSDDKEIISKPNKKTLTYDEALNIQEALEDKAFKANSIKINKLKI